MLIELHMIQNHAPSNLNRDDSGSPKHCTFGGIKRARISSQCLKRSIRQAWMDSGDPGLEAFTGKRTAGLLEHLADLVMKKDQDAERAAALLAARELLRALYVKKVRVSKKTGKVDTAYALFLSASEKKKLEDHLQRCWDDLKNAASELNKVEIEQKGKSNLSKQDKDEREKKESALTKAVENSLAHSPFSPGAMTVDLAMFGRMIADYPDRNVEACVQVAHAMSTHAMDHEFDYFTAVDDLGGSREEDDTGAEMIGDVEFNSACYYKYFSIDIGELLDNLAGKKPVESSTDREKEEYNKAHETARETVLKAIPAFIRAAVFTTPPGKQNSFAAHQLPDGILVEVRPVKTPVSYANAFVKPARAKGETDLVAASLDQFRQHVESLTTKFSLKAQPRLWFCTRGVKINGTEEKETLDQFIDGIENALSTQRWGHD